MPIESRNALCQSLTSTSDRCSLNSGPFLLGAVRADIDPQIGWAKTEVRRQTRHTALVAALSGVAVLAALGADIAGLIAVYTWLATQQGTGANINCGPASSSR